MALGLFLYRYRSYTPLPLLAIALWFGNPDSFSIVVGAGVCAVGEALRVWGIFTAGPLTRMQSAPGGDELVTHGPYAYLRNPLYLGNMMLYTGIGIMTSVWWIAAVAWIYFYGQYFFIIREEEAYLSRTFGERYRIYQQRVHRFLPRMQGYVEDVMQPPLWRSATEAIRSERRTFQALIIATLLMTVMAIF